MLGLLEPHELDGGRITSLSDLDHANLEAPLPEPDKLLGDSVASAIAAFLVHESYHAGQVGILRYSAGEEGLLS